jgi:hypothetical protein
MLVPWLVMAQAPYLRYPAWRGWLTDRSVPSLRKTLLVAALVVLAFLWSAPGQWVLSRQPMPLDRGVYGGTPWQVAFQLEGPDGVTDEAFLQLRRYLRRYYPEGHFRGGIFTSETAGDYLVWALAPQTPLFIYTHVHLFPAQAWEDCVTIKHALPGWEEILKHHQVNLVVIEPELYPALRNALYGDAAWQLLLDEFKWPGKRDPRARLLVAVRKVPL